MTIGICKFCGQEKELIASHIIPKCLYQLNKHKQMVGIQPSHKVIDKVNYQNGFKEPLLCAEHDTEIGIYDGYANKILNRALSKYQFINFDKIKTYLIKAPEFDYRKLRMFFISVAWRASVSSESFNLGRYEDIALRILKDEIPDEPTLFVPIVFRKNTQTAADNIAGTISAKYFGKHSLCLRFPDYEVIIIINSKHSTDENAIRLFRSMLTPQEFLVIESPLITPDDVKLIHAIKRCFAQ